MVRDDGERTQTTAKMEKCRAIPRPFQAILASLEAERSWRRCDWQLGFAVVQSPRRGMVGGAGSTAAVRERGFVVGEERETDSTKRESFGFLFVLFPIFVFVFFFFFFFF